MACFCFFFFKQKTAYELRISDWSSDVCSSDLHETPPQPDQRRQADDPGQYHIRPVHGTALSEARAMTAITTVAGSACKCRSRMADHDAIELEFFRHIGAQLIRLGTGDQIGRASCRERVCQYV